VNLFARFRQPKVTYVVQVPQAHGFVYRGPFTSLLAAQMFADETVPGGFGVQAVVLSVMRP
jgi:hypothetical protein